MKRFLLFSALLILSIVLNLASWVSSAFADFYTDHVFPLWTSALGRVTSIMPFSVGEILLILAVILILAALLMLAAFPFLKTNNVFRLHMKKYYTILAALFSWVIFVQTLGCFIQYHCTPLEVSLPGYGQEMTLEDLAALRDLVAGECNELSQQVQRNKNGLPICTVNMEEEARSCVQRLGNDFPRLMGWQVRPKGLLLSGFISQQYMQGYYFPFSMEANYNRIMMDTNKPFSMCHELAHTHGYILEDDANFLAYLACLQSEDVFFQYSGWLGILNYVDNDFYYAVSKDEYYSHTEILQTVRDDNRFLTDDAWDKVEESSILDTETVKKAADTYVDTTLRLNGVASGRLSYSHVVALLLDYYAPIL